MLLQLFLFRVLQLPCCPAGQLQPHSIVCIAALVASLTLTQPGVANRLVPGGCTLIMLVGRPAEPVDQSSDSCLRFTERHAHLQLPMGGSHCLMLWRTPSKGCLRQGFYVPHVWLESTRCVAFVASVQMLCRHCTGKCPPAYLIPPFDLRIILLIELDLLWGGRLAHDIMQERPGGGRLLKDLKV